jgi:hypothetical protein
MVFSVGAMEGGSGTVAARASALTTGPANVAAGQTGPDDASQRILEDGKRDQCADLPRM